MPYNASILGNFDEMLETSSLEWTISSKSNSFNPVKVRLDKYNPKAPNGYHVTVSVQKPGNPSEPSSSACSMISSSSSSSLLSSESSEVLNKEPPKPRPLLPEMSFTPITLSEMVSKWPVSGEGNEMGLTMPPTNELSEVVPDEVIPGREKAQNKGKAKEEETILPLPPDGPPGDSRSLNLQPHYRSLLDDF